MERDVSGSETFAFPIVFSSESLLTRVRGKKALSLSHCFGGQGRTPLKSSS